MMQVQSERCWLACPFAVPYYWCWIQPRSVQGLRICVLAKHFPGDADLRAIVSLLLMGSGPSASST